MKSVWWPELLLFSSEAWSDLIGNWYRSKLNALKWNVVVGRNTTVQSYVECL